MSVDLTDPDVSNAYDDIIKNRGKDWLLLTYGQTRDKLSLLASGEGDFNTLCRSIPSIDIYFGFCRERDGDKNYFALISFVPNGISGVRRARALVHQRAVGSLFKAANISMNVSELNASNTNKLRERLHLGPSLIPRLASNTNSRAVQRSASMPSEPRSSADSGSGYGSPQSPRVRGTASDSQGRRSPTPTGLYAHMPSIPSEFDESQFAPPTPPKDPVRSASAFVKSASMSPLGHTGYRSASEIGWDQPSSRARAYSKPELAYMSDGDEVVISPGSLNRRRGQMDFAHPNRESRVLSPAEKARIRLEMQKQRDAEEQRALQEEALRQERLKREKEETLRQAQEEDERRLAKLEDEKRRALIERARREREAQLEEERRLREMELRKLQAKERRMEQTRRFEEERREIERRASDAARKREEELRLTDQMRRQRMKDIQKKFAGRSGTDSVLLTGSVTVQASMSISWKRRFFELTEKALTLYRDYQDRTTPVDIIPLAGKRVAGIKEPHEGYEELEAIPYSFAVEFTDGGGAWCMFTDSAEDKDILVSLLSRAAGL
ncbi:hypothetical protein DFH11DRAFT_1579887 [Phellopilus nigrolimitatus]|nr:hypothetical protein DFH11DRAFT_1579887 [Phellopilus nigrolimitatus]